MTVEIYRPATAAFLPGSGGISQNVVLHEIFNDVDLVGRPLTIGNFVSSSAAGGFISATTSTYTPYVELGDAAFIDTSNDQILTGTVFQEVLTNFPLGSEIVTGLFLEIAMLTPKPNGTVQTETIDKTLLDKIGFAARQNGSNTTVSIAPGGLPTISEFDLVTLDVATAAEALGSVQPRQARAVADNAVLTARLEDPTIPDDDAVSNQLTRQVLRNETIVTANSFAVLSDEVATRASGLARVVDYLDSPRIVAVSSTVVIDPDTSMGATRIDIDILRDKPRVALPPGQAVAAGAAMRQLQGIYDSIIEASIFNTGLPNASTLSPNSSMGIFVQALSQPGVIAVQLSPGNLLQLPGLGFSPEANARITAAVLGGETVLVPSRAVNVNGIPRIAWLQKDASNNTVAVSDNGLHNATDEEFSVLGMVRALINYLKTLFGKGGPGSGPVNGGANAAKNVKNLEQGVSRTFVAGAEVLGNVATANFMTGESTARRLGLGDPPIGDLLFGNFPRADAPDDLAFASEVVAANLLGGTLSGAARTTSGLISGSLAASWNSNATNVFATTTLSAPNAAVFKDGQMIGSGVIARSSTVSTAVQISGSNSFAASGVGTLSFYGPAEVSLGVSGEWASYSATATGSLTITLTADGLTLNGQALAAGTYTIIANSATLSGSGATTAPNFSGTATVTATSAALNLGPSTGNVTLGGSAIPLSSGAAFAGYSGSLGLVANGDGTETATLSGTASKVLAISGSPAALTTDQNTSTSFQVHVNTSFADTYDQSVIAPPGWIVTIDNSGNITALPSAGLQSGTHLIEVIARPSTIPI